MKKRDTKWLTKIIFNKLFKNKPNFYPFHFYYFLKCCRLVVVFQIVYTYILTYIHTYIYIDTHTCHFQTITYSSRHLFSYLAMASFIVFSCCLILITNLFVVFDFSYAQPARAFFIFGDSLADNGNNHFLLTTLRADLPPYGIDLPTHKPNGRFSNGLNIPDIISICLICY